VRISALYSKGRGSVEQSKEISDSIESKKLFCQVSGCQLLK